jgi:hypothetical protein
MEIINFFNCRDHYEARQKEQEYFVLLNATLNSIEPMPKPKFKPIKVMENNNDGNINKQILSKKYSCQICNYNTDRKSNIENHLNSLKHIQEINGNKNKQILSNNFECEICNKIYQTSGGLWKHKQKCKIKEQVNITNKDELIMILIKQNTELIKEQTSIKQMIIDQQNAVLEIAKNGTHNTINNNNNSHNKTFNLQLFLNETCKDAMNIMDFVDSIKLQLSDLERVGEIGYVEGISNIITSNLNALDVTQRPIHCADKKREVLYIKDENKWEKEDDDKKKIRKAIKRVASKNQRLLPKFKEAHPDCNRASSKFSDQYNKIIVESMGGSGDNDSEKEDKIIKNITKVTTIEKT